MYGFVRYIKVVYLTKKRFRLNQTQFAGFEVELERSGALHSPFCAFLRDKSIIFSFYGIFSASGGSVDEVT